MVCEYLKFSIIDKMTMSQNLIYSKILKLNKISDRMALAHRENLTYRTEEPAEKSYMFTVTEFAKTLTAIQ